MPEILQQRPLRPARDILADLQKAGVDTSSYERDVRRLVRFVVRKKGKRNTSRAAERPGCEWSVAAGMVGDAGLCLQIAIVKGGGE